MINALHWRPQQITHTTYYHAVYISMTRRRNLFALREYNNSDMKK